MNARQLSHEVPSPQEDLRQQLYFLLRQPGGDPSQLLELLAVIVENRLWEQGGQAFIPFLTTAFDDGGVGWSLQNVQAILLRRHPYEEVDPDTAGRMVWLRQEVEHLLSGPADPNASTTTTRVRSAPSPRA